MQSYLKMIIILKKYIINLYNNTRTIFQDIYDHKHLSNGYTREYIYPYIYKSQPLVTNLWVLNDFTNDIS
jgi:hypothetical protein